MANIGNFSYTDDSGKKVKHYGSSNIFGKIKKSPHITDLRKKSTSRNKALDRMKETRDRISKTKGFTE